MTTHPACLTLLAVALCGCPRGAAKTGKPRLPPQVAVAAVQQRDVPVEVRAPLDLRPLVQADVSSKLMGYIDAILVDRGDRVKKGQTLALVRPSDLPDQLQASRAAQRQAESNLERTRLDYDRTEALYKHGSIAQAQLDYALNLRKAAEGALEATKAQVAALGTRLGEARIVSPMDGVVSQRRLDPGALVGNPASPPMLTIDRIDVLRAFIPVPEREAGLVSVGQVAFVDVDAIPGKRLEGRVARLAPSFDVMSRTLDAEVHLPNPDLALRPGMYGRGCIVTATHTGITVVPVTSLVIGRAGKHVFVLKGDKVERRPVETGVDGDTWVEVTAGLKPGEEVVVAGVEALSDGAQVRAVRDVDPISGRPLTAPVAAKKDDPVAAPGVR